jgi:mannosyl-3-phosphoglycerate phosphatase
MVNKIVLTAWDGAFLEALRADETLPLVMASLKEKGVPVIVFTQCDRAELEPIRQQLAWTDPFITESGSGIFTPVEHNPFAEALGERDGDYYVQELGCPYVQARAGLRVLANTIGHPLKGFGDFTVPQLQKFLGITEAEAHRAKAREFSELFMTPKAVETAVLTQAAQEMGFEVILRDPDENRFSELMGPGAGVEGAIPLEGLAIAQLIAAYQHQLPAEERLRVLGLSNREEELIQLGEAISLEGFAIAPADWHAVRVSEPTAWSKAVEDWIERMNLRNE